MPSPNADGLASGHPIKFVNADMQHHPQPKTQFFYDLLRARALLLHFLFYFMCTWLIWILILGHARDVSDVQFMGKLPRIPVLMISTFV